MKGISRSEMNQLMAIPEARQIIDAKFVELRLIFRNKLKGNNEPPPDLEVLMSSNIIRLPVSRRKSLKKDSTPVRTGSSTPGKVKIVDASRYRNAPESEQVKTFMDYFKNHPVLRKAVLDEFFLRILPYSNELEKLEG